MIVCDRDERRHDGGKHARMEVVDFVYHRRPKAEKAALRNQFDQEIRRDFLKSLAQRRVDLAAAGFSQQQVATLARGHVPHGYQVHHIRPLDDGGTNDFSNLVLIRAHPDHEAIHRVLDPQIQSLAVGESRTVRMPMVTPGIYSPPTARRDAALAVHSARVGRQGR